MKKQPDFIEKWSKKTKNGRVYYFHRKAVNGNIISVAKYKSRSGRNKAVNKILATEKLKVVGL